MCIYVVFVDLANLVIGTVTLFLVSDKVTYSNGKYYKLADNGMYCIVIFLYK